MKPQKHIIRIDGIPTQLKAPDLDGDGLTNEAEDIVFAGASGVQNIVQNSELGDSLKELNKDIVNPQTRMTDMDMRSRLHYVEVSSILALDALVAFRICPTQCLSFTRQKKRLSVSQAGKGREEIVQIVGGKREQDMKSGSLFSQIKEKFGGGAQ